jgi:hypothetical protein
MQADNKTPSPETNQAVADELRSLQKTLDEIQGHWLFVGNRSLGHFLFISLLRGVTVGFGTVLGATIVVSVFVYLLSQIEFIPIIGDMVKLIIAEVGKK